MKKILALLFFLIPLNVFAYSASSIIAMDLDTGRVLDGYNINEKRLIASTTKIMTAIVALENADIELSKEVSDIIYKAYGSAIYIEVGEKLTLKDLLYGLILRSGNDAALEIAVRVSGSVEEFVYLMNEYASNIGMENTHFYNPHGLEDNNGDANISTAYDMAKLTKYAMQNATFREIFKTKEHTVKTNYKTYVWHNKNKLLSEDYITGGKTGFTKLARRTLVTTASKDNMDIVVVTLNDPDDWDDHRSLYNKIFENYKSYQILFKDNFFIENENYFNNKLYINNDYYLTLQSNELPKVTIDYELMKLEDYVDDSLVGYAKIKIGDTYYHKEPIYVKLEEKQEKLNWWQKLWRGLFK